MVRGWPRAIDMNVSRLETIEHIREFLAGTAEVGFSHPADESARRIFVATVLKRYRYVGLSKGPRGVLFAYMDATPDGLFTPAFVPAYRAVSRYAVTYAPDSRQPDQLRAYLRTSRCDIARRDGGAGLRGGLGPGP